MKSHPRPSQLENAELLPAFIWAQFWRVFASNKPTVVSVASSIDK